MRKKTFFIISILLALYTLLFFFKLTEIGPEYDELAFINAAYGCPNSSMFLHLTYPFNGSCLPVMIMPYLGAPHAYILRTVFHFFDPNLFNLRAINYFMMLASFILIYCGLRKTLSRNALLLVFLFLVLDPQLLLVARYERTVITPFLLKSLFIFFLFYSPPFTKYIKPLILGFIIGFAVYSKLDIIFVIGSFVTGIVAASFLYRDELKKIIRSIHLYWYSIVIFLTGVLIGITPLLVYVRRSYQVIIDTNKILSAAPDLPQKKIFYLFTQLSATQLFEAAFREKLVFQPSWILSSVLFIILLYVTILLIKKNWVLSILSLSLLAFYLMVIFYHGLGAWGKMHHLVLIYPLPQVLLAYYFYQAKHFLLMKIYIAILLCLLVIVYFNFQILSSQTCGRQNWSCAIYDGMDVLQKNSREIVVGDWGLATQFLFLTKGERPINELVFKADASNPKDISSIMNELQKNCANFVMSAPEATRFLKAREVMIPFLKSDAKYHKTVVFDREHIPYLEIYQCSNP